MTEGRDRTLRLLLQTETSIPGGLAYVLCYADGHALPGQVSVTLKQRVGQLTTVTVEFNVDGQSVIAGGDLMNAIIEAARPR